MLEKNGILSAVTPDRCSKDAKCKFYRSNKPITYARGYARSQKQMFPNKLLDYYMWTVVISPYSRNWHE